MSLPRRSTNPAAAGNPRRRLLLLTLASLVVLALVILLVVKCSSSPHAAVPSASPSSPELVAPTATVTQTVKSDKPQPAFPAEFGDGFWLVGKQIAPVQYTNRDTTNPQCFWARVDKATFPHPHIVQMSEGKAGSFKVVIHPSDQVFYTRNCGNWKHID